jgi:hypothetical protein
MKAPSALSAFVAVLLASVATAAEAVADETQMIYLSPDLATGILIGLFLLGLVIFAVTMLDGIETSDRIGQTKPTLVVQTNVLE